jgi:8-oxo-dGTP pyrophosphatase MutT (NUDIX family)
MDGDVDQWQVLYSEKLCDDVGPFQLFSRHHRQVRNGKEGNFFLLHCRDWVQIIPLTSDGHLILVKQYRFGSQTISLETPGGGMEDGESIFAAAQRELWEETGYVGENPQLIASVFPNPAIQDNQMHSVFLKNCQPTGQQHLDPLEEVSICPLTIRDVYEKVQRNVIHHALSINALLLAKPMVMEEMQRQSPN